jgi:TPR repeat protein
MWSGSERMRDRILLPLLVFRLFVCSYDAMARAPESAQAPVTFAPQPPKWTESDKRALIDRAKHGDANAQMWLGSAYEQGWFGKADYQAALFWFRRSASRNNPDAQNSLGQMYEDGDGVKQDFTQAAKWYRKAAEHVPDFGGAGQGRNNLGLLYVNGRGVPRDYVQAYMWFRLANTEDNVSSVKDQMTPAQIIEAERLANEWKVLHSKS